ncbi:MAG: sigma-70 family RNA polymerase sigma factor [Lentisphaeraceae bacterium]|nr:sigma-70 family RNA polymerase sigma factor [Lentisphaeraceae bacterium]
MPDLMDDIESDSLFENQFEQIRIALLRFIISLTSCRTVSDDLVQETFMTLWKKRDSFEPGSNFKAWAFQTAFNLVRNYRRTMARNLEQTMPSEKIMGLIRDKYMQQESFWEAESKFLPECLQQLPEKQQQLITRRYIGKVSLQNLAPEWELSPNALSQLLFRIKKSLKKCVQSKQNNRSQRGES